MGKLYFKHGVMSSGKTATLLMSEYTYRENGIETLLLKPSLDKRSSTIKSRVGLEVDCLTFSPEVDLYDLITTLDVSRIGVIFIDEAQFINKKQATELARIAMEYKTDVVCYGLMLTFLGEVFEGAKALIEVGAKLSELKSVGEGRLTHHLLYEDGKVVKSGDIVQSSSDKVYKSVTFKKFLEEINNDEKCSVKKAIENECNVNCKTKIEAEEFCKFLHEFGIKWRNGEDCINNTFWDEFREKTIYIIEGNTISVTRDSGGDLLYLTYDELHKIYE